MFNLGILDMYMRLLDVFSRYIHDLRQSESPDLTRKKIKIFDTASVNRIIRDQQENKGMDLKLDDELMHFFEYDIFVLPFLNKSIKRCWLVVIELIEENIFITLWDRDRPEHHKSQLEDYNTDISSDVLDFLDRAYIANAAEFKPNKVEGCEEIINVKEETDMIPAVLQLAEGVVIDHESYVPSGDILDVRHKIVDRLASLYLLE